MQELYQEPIKPELIEPAHPRDQGRRRHRLRVGHPAAHRESDRRRSSPPSSTSSSSRARSSRPSTCPSTVEPLNLKKFVRELDIPVIVGGCASYQAALHLMRTGAAGVLVGVGPGHACTTRGVLGIGVPQATAIADARAARMRHLDETGVYVHVIADGGMRHRRRHRQGHRLRRRRRDDRLAAGRGRTRRRVGATTGAWPPSIPRCPAAPGCRSAAAARSRRSCVGSGPRERRARSTCSARCAPSMATCGYETVKEFQKAEVMVAPALQTEGKNLQRAQGVGMGQGVALRRRLAPRSSAGHRCRRPRPRRRLRRPVRPADRPAGPRGARLLRDRPAHDHRRRDRRAQPGGDHLLAAARKSVHVEGAPALDPAIYDLGIPILGICYGAQLDRPAARWRGRPRPAGASTAGPTLTRSGRRRRCCGEQPAAAARCG